MQTPNSSACPMPVAIAVLTAVLFLVAPLVAAGQWAPVDTVSADLEILPLSSEVVRERMPLPLGVPLSTLTLSSSPHNPLPVLEEKSLRKRLLPYVLGGAALGGIAGYVYHDRVNQTPIDEDWGVGYFYVTVLGAEIGALAGALVGYIIERR